MYDEFFGLKETPFSIAPDPRFLYMSERHREALAHLVYGVGTDGGFILLSGEVGTGKTTISRCLLEQIPENANVAMILNPKLLSGELLATICDELQVDYPEGNTSIKVFVDCINAYLLETHASGKKTVVLIEESQNLDPDVLEQLRLLTNLETNQRKLLQVIMIGQPELLDLLARPELRQLEQRITARYHLMPLSLKDTIDYIKHRLSVAGVKEPVFSSSALRKVYKITGGVPRKINILCDRAMLGAYTRNQKHVDKKILSKAAQEVFGDEAKTQHTRESSKQKPSRVLTSIVAIVVIAAVVVLVYMNFSKIESWFNQNQVVSLEQQTKQAIQWIDSDLIQGDQTPAYKSLFQAWGTVYANTAMDSCEFARSVELACLKQQGDLEELLEFNRPAVIALKNDDNERVYVLLKQVSKDSATLKSGDQQHQIRHDELLRRWADEYTILWREPPNFSGVIKPGNQGQEVKWLADKLAKLNRTGQVAEADIVYGPGLRQQVKDFQTQSGLQADGVAGIQTLIRINTLVDTRVPRLIHTEPKTSLNQIGHVGLYVGSSIVSFNHLRSRVG